MNDDINQRAIQWIVGRDTGASSKALWAQMQGTKGSREHPGDPGDIGRCFRLLELIPEWKPRLSEMKAVSPYWAALVDKWDEIRTLMDAESGIDWSKSLEAKKTYKLMRSILDPIKDADSKVVRFGPNATIRF